MIQQTFGAPETLQTVLSFVGVVVALVAGVAIPLIISRLPRITEERRREAFLRLIRCEVAEMKPEASGRSWPEFLDKTFVHQTIFQEPSINREFILSLPEDLVYNISQMWSDYEQAKEAMGKAGATIKLDQSTGRGKAFLAHLGYVCGWLDQSDKNGELPNKNKRPTMVVACPDKSYCRAVYYEWKTKIEVDIKEKIVPGSKIEYPHCEKWCSENGDSSTNSQAKEEAKTEGVSSSEKSGT